MFKFISKISGKAKKIMLSVGTGILAAATMAIGAFAEEPAAGTAQQDLQTVVNTAGTTLKDQFIILVNTLVPVLIGIGVVGLGLYACIYLFKMAKKFFGQATK
jgi:hypothetical protein|nr:MAG TPA: hypothetical protein [Inoviridae sp.]